MKFAPVVIATLDRYEHFRKCIMSLSSCTHADKTEVYVALDYPPSEKYIEGWKKNKKFLETCGNLGFKELHVICRDHNYGTWKPGDEGNMRCLVKMVREKYDSYIVTEDDNVFSPCFLDYINKGLEKFQDDEKVDSIVGYKLYVPGLKFCGNTFSRQSIDYNMWGVGYWTEKTLSRPELDYKWFRKQLTFKNILLLKKKAGIGGICRLVNLSCTTKRTIVIDVDLWAYLVLTDKQQIFPSQTLVENIGLDGSGASMRDSRGQEWCDPTKNCISSSITFDYIGTGYENYEENMKVYAEEKFFKSNWTYRYILIKKIAKLITHWKE